MWRYLFPSIILLVQLSIGSAESVIRINAASGNDSKCLPPGQIPCQSLEHVQAASNFLKQSNIAIFIETNITLTGIIWFENLSNVTISGSTPAAGSHHGLKRIRCSAHARSAFFVNNVSDISPFQTWSLLFVVQQSMSTIMKLHYFSIDHLTYI